MGTWNKRILSNSVWMILEKVISIFGLIFVTSFVAKYIGPENFGKLTFASSIFAIIQTLAMFGSDNIIFQKTSKNVKVGERIIESTKSIRSLIYIVSSFGLLVYLYFNVDQLTFIFSLSTCIALYFALHDVYSIYFNAILQSKINTYCNVLALMVSLFLRFLVVEFKLAIEWLCLPIILITFIPYLMRRIIFNKKKAINYIDGERIKIYRNYMLNAGRKLVLYTLSVAIFTKTSQLFLGMKSQYDLGIYTVAATLGTSYYFVLTALISSIMTQIYIEQSFQKSQKMAAQLNAIVIIISILALIFFLLFGQWIVYFLYGEAFAEAADILWIMVFVCLFSGLSTVAEKYLIKFNAYTYLQQKTNMLVIFNILLTFAAVKFYGLYGAVLSILLTEIASTTVFNYFYSKQSKIIILDTHKKIFLPTTYLK
ncbi:oligosaccharide flippase family protein [Acinetobacter proteolyticus]|uniref:oligosaccharide flippase family protein n=1 Tax=Acinetobacter proteolyticus TaxID=1776741 RepID=UPI0031DAE466